MAWRTFGWKLRLRTKNMWVQSGYRCSERGSWINGTNGEANRELLRRYKFISWNRFLGTHALQGSVCRLNANYKHRTQRPGFTGHCTISRADWQQELKGDKNSNPTKWKIKRSNDNNPRDRRQRK